MIFCGEERKSTRASLHGARHRRANCFALRGGDPNRGMGIKEKRHRGRGHTLRVETHNSWKTVLIVLPTRGWIRGVSNSKVGYGRTQRRVPHLTYIDHSTFRTRKLRRSPIIRTQKQSKMVYCGSEKAFEVVYHERKYRRLKLSVHI